MSNTGTDRTLYYPDTLRGNLDRSGADGSAVSAMEFTIYRRLGPDNYHRDRLIYLYMPETLANPTNVTWDTGGVGAGGATAIAKPDDVLANKLSDVAEGGMTALAKTMLGKLKGGLGEARGQDVFDLQTQQVTNPYLKMMFRGVNFRNFEFLFKFTPHTPEESEEIQMIIQSFRAAALPATTPNGEAINAANATEPDPQQHRLHYPKEIEIKYVYQGSGAGAKVHPYLNKFKRCVITDLQLNYTSAGFYATMRDGFPAQTELRLQFSEIDLVYREDIALTGESF